MVKIKPSISVVQLCCVLVGILWIFPLAARADCSSDAPQQCTEDECGSKSVNDGTWVDGQCKVTSNTTTPPAETETPTPTADTSTATDEKESTTPPVGTETPTPIADTSTTTDEKGSTTPPAGTETPTPTVDTSPATDEKGSTTPPTGTETTTIPVDTNSSTDEKGSTTPPAGTETTTIPADTKPTTEGDKGSTTTPTGTELPTLKVFGIDNAGQSVNGINAVFTGGISIDGGTSFLDATKTPVELKKGGGIQIKGSINPDSHVGSEAELIVVGLHTSDTEDRSCDLAKGKHTYYMMVDATPTSEIYCEWKDGGECKDDKNLPRVKSKNSADSYYTEWTGWDTTLANLKPFLEIKSLDKLDEIPLYVDNNVSYTGFVCVNFGYRLDNKTLIFNAESLMFRVSE